ncbi:MAG: acetyl-CoA carboxylase biotin carboxyl carrier protein subunit [Bacteroidetes bacterium]|nr:acetyl-CoA carboxylase biotin carboxyl carrier protein subunit [Bacteroidota bacterium]
MKAIIADKTIELEEKEGLWLPINSENISIQKLEDGKLFLLVNGRTFTATLLSADTGEKTVELLLNNKKYKVQLKEALDDLLHSMGLDKAISKGATSIKAPMPGLVLEVSVEAGATVSKGDKVLVLEAMKMENVIKSPGDGIVARILVNKGETVDKNQVLIEFS